MVDVVVLGDEDIGRFYGPTPCHVHNEVGNNIDKNNLGKRPFNSPQEKSELGQRRGSPKCRLEIRSNLFNLLMVWRSMKIKFKAWKPN